MQSLTWQAAPLPLLRSDSLFSKGPTASVTQTLGFHSHRSHQPLKPRLRSFCNTECARWNIGHCLPLLWLKVELWELWKCAIFTSRWVSHDSGYRYMSQAEMFEFNGFVDPKICILSLCIHPHGAPNCFDFLLLLGKKRRRSLGVLYVRATVFHRYKSILSSEHYKKAL